MEHNTDVGNRLLAALCAVPGLQDAGWEYLFDQENRLIEARSDELAGVPTYLHPRRAHYSALAQRVGGGANEIFVRNETEMAAYEDSRVEAIFTSQGAAARVPRFKVLGDREAYRLNPARLRAGILTQGGNAPGYNVVIDSIVKRHALLSTPAEAEARTNPDGTSPELKLFGFEDGFAGLGRHAPRELRVWDTDKVALKPGSLLRLNANVMESVDEEACWRAVTRHRIDILYVIGNRNAISMADRACQALENAVGQAGERIRIIGAPVTVEDDFAFNEGSIGFQSALANAVEFLQRVHSEAEACRHLAVVALPGEYSGSLALHASYASGEVDYALLPEMLGPVEAAQKEEVERAGQLLTHRYRNKRHALAVLSTLKDSAQPGMEKSGTGKASVADRFSEDLRARLAHEPLGPDGLAGQVVVHLAQTLGSGEPLPYDVNLGKLTGKLMVDAALSGLSRCVICQWRGRFVAVPMRFAIGRPKTVNLRGYGPRTMSEKYLLTPVSHATTPSQFEGVSEYFG